MRNLSFNLLFCNKIRDAFTYMCLSVYLATIFNLKRRSKGAHINAGECISIQHTVWTYTQTLPTFGFHGFRLHVIIYNYVFIIFFVFPRFFVLEFYMPRRSSSQFSNSQICYYFSTHNQQWKQQTNQPNNQPTETIWFRPSPNPTNEEDIVCLCSVLYYFLKLVSFMHRSSIHPSIHRFMDRALYTLFSHSKKIISFHFEITSSRRLISTFDMADGYIFFILFRNFAIFFLPFCFIIIGYIYFLIIPTASVSSSHIIRLFSSFKKPLRV